jgi:hypothetical protein
MAQVAKPLPPDNVALTLYSAAQRSDRQPFLCFLNLSASQNTVAAFRNALMAFWA